MSPLDIWNYYNRRMPSVPAGRRDDAPPRRSGASPRSTHRLLEPFASMGSMPGGSVERGTAQDARTRVAAAVILLVVGSAVALVSLLEAYSRPLWHDEVYTAIITDLPTLGDIPRALNDAVDANPPLYYYLARVARAVVADDHVAYRLPSIAGFLLAFFCVYAVLARRVDRLSALTGTSLLLALPVVADFAFEARPYAPMLGCVALAVLAWQRTSDRPAYAWLVGLSLGAALSLHYYAALVWPAFAVAELAIWVRRREFRAMVWGALVVGLAPLLVFADHLATIRAYYGVNLWAPPAVRQVISDPNWLFGVRNGGAVIALGIAAWLVLRVVIPPRARVVTPVHRLGPAPAALFDEAMLSLGLLALPVLAVTAALIMGSDLTARYILPVVIGAAIGVGLAVSNTAPAFRWFLVVIMVGGYSVQAAALAPDLFRGRLAERRTDAARRLETMLNERAPSQQLPVVVSDAHQYLQLTRYANPALRGSLYILVDPPAAVRFAPSDSSDRNLQALRRYADLRIVDFAAFAATRRDFVLVSSGATWDWWPARLAEDGHELRLVVTRDGVRVYRVSLTGNTFAATLPAASR